MGQLEKRPAKDICIVCDDEYMQKYDFERFCSEECYETGYPRLVRDQPTNTVQYEKYIQEA